MDFISIDPSLSNTGIVYWRRGKPYTSFVLTTKPVKKKRKKGDPPINIQDLNRMSLYHQGVLSHLSNPSYNFVVAEIPQGSQSADAVKGYAATLCLLMRIKEKPVHTFSPNQLKKYLGIDYHTLKKLGKPSLKEKQSKDFIVNYVEEHYPGFLPRKKDGTINFARANHIADAVVLGEMYLRGEESIQI